MTELMKSRTWCTHLAFICDSITRYWPIFKRHFWNKTERNKSKGESKYISDYAETYKKMGRQTDGGVGVLERQTKKIKSQIRLGGSGSLLGS